MSHPIKPAAVSPADTTPVAESAEFVASSAGQSASDAFDTFRGIYALKPLPRELIANEDQVKPMHAEDGLMLWERRALGQGGEDPGAPAITTAMDAGKFLWVVESNRVP